MKTIKNINKLKGLIGQTVYYVRTCKDMPEKTDGDYYTATGLYCVYEGNCPWEEQYKEICKKCEVCTANPWNEDEDNHKCGLDDIGSCEENKKRYNIFEDYIDGIIIKDDYEIITLERCGAVDVDEINVNVFFTREKAEKRLKQIKENNK